MSRKTEVLRRLVELSEEQEALEAELRSFGFGNGETTAVAEKPVERRGRKPAGSTTPKAEKHTRPQNNVKLPQLILNILQDSKDGYDLSELTRKILNSGYKTEANDFPMVVYQNCMKLSKKGQVTKENKTYRATA